MSACSSMYAQMVPITCCWGWQAARDVRGVNLHHGGGGTAGSFSWHNGSMENEVHLVRARSCSREGLGESGQIVHEWQPAYVQCVCWECAKCSWEFIDNTKWVMKIHPCVISKCHSAPKVGAHTHIRTCHRSELWSEVSFVSWCKSPGVTTRTRRTAVHVNPAVRKEEMPWNTLGCV